MVLGLILLGISGPRVSGAFENEMSLWLRTAGIHRILIVVVVPSCSPTVPVGI
jgi:hypothetical protein